MSSIYDTAGNTGSWALLDVGELVRYRDELRARQNEAAAPGMAGLAGGPGQTTSINTGPYVKPFGKMLRRSTPTDPDGTGLPGVFDPYAHQNRTVTVTDLTGRYSRHLRK